VSSRSRFITLFLNRSGFSFSRILSVTATLRRNLLLAARFDWIAIVSIHPFAKLN
jgi:hypothetical protein